MATSEVQICNNALIKVGSDVISSLTENTKGAKLCNQLYEPIRDELLRLHPWNFAVERVELAAEVASPLFGFEFKFTLPSDFIRLLDVYDYVTRYRIEGNNIFSDDNNLKIVYIKKETNPGKFDSAFTEVLATRIASEISYSLSGSRTLSDSLLEIYTRKLASAKMVDAQENFNDSIKVDTFTRARLTGSSEDYLLHPKPS